MCDVNAEFVMVHLLKYNMQILFNWQSTEIDFNMLICASLLAVQVF